MKTRCVIDNAIGETRAAVWEGKTLTEFYVRRWSDAGMPRRGDLFAGRVRKVEKSLGAAFIDLGSGPDGFLKFTTAPNAPRLTEGMRIEVGITREAEAEKGPNVAFVKSAPESMPGVIKGQSLKEQITERFPGITFEEANVGSLLDAVQTEMAIPGGGTLTIERTKALTAIDVDSGNAPSPFAVALAACPVIAQQLRLRGLGGLFAIDFPNLRQRRQREDLIDALDDAFEDDQNIIKFSSVSRFGVVEMTRMRLGPSIDETLSERSGDWTIETQALEALRGLQAEGRARPGAKLTLTVPSQVYAWLESGVIEWRTPLTEKLGARYEVLQGESYSVTGDR